MVGRLLSPMFTVKFHFYQDCPKCKNYHHLSLQPTVRWENPPLPVVEAAMIWSRNVIQGFICLRFCHVCFLGSFNTSHWVSTYIYNMSRKILNCSDRHIPWTLLFGGFGKNGGTQQPWVFLLKKWSFWGGDWGYHRLRVSPFWTWYKEIGEFLWGIL